MALETKHGNHWNQAILSSKEFYCSSPALFLLPEVIPPASYFLDSPDIQQQPTVKDVKQEGKKETSIMEQEVGEKKKRCGGEKGRTERKN